MTHLLPLPGVRVAAAATARSRPHAACSQSHSDHAAPCIPAVQVRRTAAAAAAASDAAPSSSSSSGGDGDGEAAAHSNGRHAFLHDFCMAIPYGALLLAGGLAAKLAGWGQPAAVMAVVGALQVLLANLSLKAWRSGKSAVATTLTEAGKQQRLLGERAIAAACTHLHLGGALLGKSAFCAPWWEG